jgi:APA family basic amino acid/polyamine antiporter
MRRTLTARTLFTIVYAPVVGALYFSLGIVTDNALGWTPLILLAASLMCALTALTYAEGSSLHQERGGSTVFARYAFNELVSFVAGWVVLLDYVILIAVTSVAAIAYLGDLWGPLDIGWVHVVCSLGVIALVAAINVLGLRPKRLRQITGLVIADVILVLVIIAIGLANGIDTDAITNPDAVAGAPSWDDLVYALTVAVIAFIGFESASGVAGEVKVNRRSLTWLVSIGMAGTLVAYVGIALVAVSVLDLGAGPLSDDALTAPLMAIVRAFEPAWLGDLLHWVVGVVAALVLVAAANSSMLGLSRLGYSLATNRMIPSAIGRLHRDRATPVVIIAIASVLAAALTIPVNIEFLVGMYAGGVLIAFTIAHVSICVLRFREPDRRRAFRIPLSIPIGRGSLPVTAVLGAVVSAAGVVAVLALHSGARIAGPLWLIGGLVLYVVYRRSGDKPLLKRVTIPEQALRSERTRSDGEYGSILVPVFGTELDDDIMQTAGRLAGAEREEGEEEEAVIEAVAILQVPMALPLDAALPEERIKTARKALARAKAVGEDYEDVRVETATVRSRRIGHAIVEEARRRGVEVIVLAAEGPSRIRGGALLGGVGGPTEDYVGDVTKYVLAKAPCRVVLTAPAREDERTAAPADDAPPPAGDRVTGSTPAVSPEQAGRDGG